MQFKDAELRDLLRMRANAAEQQQPEHTTSNADVVYALFLEPASENDQQWSTLECAIDKAVRIFQPSPALAHCELLLPPLPADEGMRTQFATYLGRKSGWQTDQQDGRDYYLLQNGGRWRAVPVFQLNATAKLRAECDTELGVDYSLARYLSAVPPGR